MGSMPEVISKGPVFKKLDARYSDTAVLRQALDALRNLPPYPKGNLADLGEARGALTKADADHVRNHWFRDWWQNAQPVEPVLREGLITAMEVALREPGKKEDRKQPLPMDFYWVCHPGHSKSSPAHSPDDYFEVSVAWSQQQVTVIMHTPEPPIEPSGPTVDEPIFVVKGVAVPTRVRVQAERLSPSARG